MNSIHSYRFSEWNLFWKPALEILQQLKLGKLLKIYKKSLKIRWEKTYSYKVGDKEPGTVAKY